MTVGEALREGAALLAAAGVDNPRLDARLLLGHAAGLSREALLRDPGRAVDHARYGALLARRAAREPVARTTAPQRMTSTMKPRVRAAKVGRPRPRRRLWRGLGMT